MAYKALIIALCFVVGVFGDDIFHYNGYSVYRLMPKTKTQVDYLHELAMTTTEIDFWTYPTGINASVDVMLSPDQKALYGKMFKDQNIESSIMVNDVEENEEKRRTEERVGLKNISLPFTRVLVPNFFTAYQRLSVFFNLMDAAVSQAPAIARIENIGKSYEGRDIRLIVLGVNPSSTTKPIYFIDSCIHAREWIGCASSAYFIQYLVDGYLANNAVVMNLLNTYNFYILPVLNPDGYEFTHTSTRLWRKTRQPNSGSTCIGTDPNRNWNNNWNLNGASQNPCSETYSGTGASSTPEVKTIQDYLITLRPRIRVYLPVHSYSQLLLYSYGYKTGLPPDNAQLLSRGNAALTALKAVNNVSGGYTIGTITNVLYAASGSAVDFGYENCGIKYVYTIELRDTGTYGFQLPVAQIVPSGNENNAFFVKLAQDVATEL